MPDDTLILPPSNIITENSSDESIATSKEAKGTVLIGNGSNLTATEYDLSEAKEYPFFI